LSNIVNSISNNQNQNITNPSLPLEVLSTSWSKAENFNAFKEKVNKFMSQIEKLKVSDLPTINNILESLFDENVPVSKKIIKNAIKKYGESFEKQKYSNNITINKATATVSGLGTFKDKVNSSNNFYGN
jgi:tyrosyl-tRNA synthetase